jgi:hypothetical protein
MQGASSHPPLMAWYMGLHIFNWCVLYNLINVKFLNYCFIRIQSPYSYSCMQHFKTNYTRDFKFGTPDPTTTIIWPLSPTATCITHSNTHPPLSVQEAPSFGSNEKVGGGGIKCCQPSWCWGDASSCLADARVSIRETFIFLDPRRSLYVVSTSILQSIT